MTTPTISVPGTASVRVRQSAPGVAAASLFVAWAWSFHFPIIKNIWSSSFVLWAGGWSLLLLALFYWIIDVQGYQRWSFFFKVAFSRRTVSML